MTSSEGKRVREINLQSGLRDFPCHASTCQLCSTRSRLPFLCAEIIDYLHGC